MGIFTYADFVNFFPNRYIDRTQFLKINELQENNSEVQIIGKIASLAKKEHNNDFFKGLRIAGGLFAIIIGIYWIFIN